MPTNDPAVQSIPSPPKTRQVAAIDGAGRGVVIDQPMPKPEAGQVLIKVHRSMISPGTELGFAKQARAEGGKAEEREPRAFGYQNAGVVVGVGEGVRQWKPGERVACMGAGYAMHSQWAVVPQNLCASIPEGVTFESAASMNLVLTGLQAIRRAQPMVGEYMLIVGMGLVGQYASQIARLAGMRVMGWDMVDSRLELAQKCGAQATANPGKQQAQSLARQFTDEHGFDAAIMAFPGDGSAALKSVASVMQESADGHAMGRIVLPGGLTTTTQWGSQLGNLDLRCSSRTGLGYHDPQWEHGQTSYPPVFVRWNTRTNLDLALHWIATSQLMIQPIITHRFALDQAGEAVDLLVNQPDQALGVIFEMDDAV